MTVLECGGGEGESESERGPPRKRLCLSTRAARAGGYMATPLDAGVMMNGYGGPDGEVLGGRAGEEGGDSGPPIATLCNLGNTCFLNSVLYTLRFAPSFLHNLHHLATDLVEFNGRYASLKNKSSSLGRGIGGGSRGGWGGGKEGGGQDDRIAVATLRLHELYEELHRNEMKDHWSPYQPDVFLTALREVNTIFEGNQQHDAHELLVCLLDNVRETCRQLGELSERPAPVTTPAVPLLPQPAPAATRVTALSHVRKSLKIGKKNSAKNVVDNGPFINGGDSAPMGVALGPSQEEEAGARVGHNFISEDYQGVTVLRTTCLECEMVTERRETFCDLCVPITPSSPANGENVSSLYHSAVVTEELLIESNKYWCEQCRRHNEARRCVRYETLPRLLTLQLKRFSSGFGSVVSKVNEYMPTPLQLSCFCERCKDTDTKMHPRGYRLYGVIMHLGATMASGHYVSYVCARDTAADCATCSRDRRKTASLSGAKPSANANDKHAGGLLRFFKTQKPVPVDARVLPPCRGADCCGCAVRATSELWLECDDETVRTMSRKQLEDILAPKSAKNSALTPYLLFYARLP